MSKRLLCCTGSLDGGGSERQLWQLATRIDRHAFASQLYLLYRRGVYLDRVPADIPIHAFEDAHQAPRVAWPGTIHRRQVADLRRLLQQARIDVVYDRTFHMTLVTAPACRAVDVPRVSVIVSPPSRDVAGSRERFRWIKRRRLAAAYRDPRCLTLAVSGAVADDAAAYYGLPRGRIRVVPNPVDTPQVQQLAQQPCVALPAADVRIVVSGRLTAEKGQRLAIAAVAALQRQRPQCEVRLEMLGDGPERKALEGQAHRLGVAQRIGWHGFQKNPYPFMRQADIVCIPSLYEGLPNVALESMALGVPVLAADCSQALTELLGAAGERGVLVPVNDANALAEAILDFVDQRQAWSQRAQQARDYVCQHHDLQAWLQLMQGILADALANYHGAAPA